MTFAPGLRVPARAILCLAVLGVAAESYYRASNFDFDFHHFYRDARYLWEHGALNPNHDDPDPLKRQQLPFYLPIVPLALAPITAAGQPAAVWIWAILQGASCAGCFWLLRERLARTTPKSNIDALLAITVIIAAPALFEAAKFNQLSFHTLLLVLLGLRALDHGREIRGGAWLAAAALLKLLPAIFLLWLLLKRRWRASFAFLITSALIAVIPCAIAFGPQRTADYHADWWQYNGTGDSARGMVNPELREHFLNHDNQSIAAVIARIAWLAHPYPAPIRAFDWSKETCGQISAAISALLLVALAIATRHPARALTESSLRIESAVFAIGMIVFAPLLRQYYLIWALPALCVAVDLANRERHRLAWIALGTWILSMLAWTSKDARSLGANLIALIAIGALLLAMRDRPRNTSAPAINSDSSAAL